MQTTSTKTYPPVPKNVARVFDYTADTAGDVSTKKAVQDISEDLSVSGSYSYKLRKISTIFTQEDVRRFGVKKLVDISNHEKDRNKAIAFLAAHESESTRKTYEAIRLHYGSLLPPEKIEDSNARTTFISTVARLSKTQPFKSEKQYSKKAKFAVLSFTNINVKLVLENGLVYGTIETK